MTASNKSKDALQLEELKGKLYKIVPKFKCDADEDWYLYLDDNEVRYLRDYRTDIIFMLENLTDLVAQSNFQVSNARTAEAKKNIKAEFTKKIKENRKEIIDSITSRLAILENLKTKGQKEQMDSLDALADETIRNLRDGPPPGTDPTLFIPQDYLPQAPTPDDDEVNEADFNNTMDDDVEIINIDDDFADERANHNDSDIVGLLKAPSWRPGLQVRSDEVNNRSPEKFIDDHETLMRETEDSEATCNIKTENVEQEVEDKAEEDGDDDEDDDEDPFLKGVSGQAYREILEELKPHAGNVDRDLILDAVIAIDVRDSERATLDKIIKECARVRSQLKNKEQLSATVSQMQQQQNSTML